MGMFGAKKEIGPDTVLQRRKDILSQDIMHETILLSLELNKYYALNGSAAIIWKLLDDKITLKEILSNLLERYKVSNEQCLNETLSFIYKLNDNKLITIM